MDEIVDILNEKGNLTGETISKNIAHSNGTWHGAIHIIIINKEKTKTLFQYRCPDKKLYPNTWDVAVGGHISKGETPMEAAKRELKEELGLNLDNYDIEEIETVKETLTYEDIYSNEFITTYLIYTDIDVNELTLQKEEVSDVKWFTKQELKELREQNQTIPHLKLFDIINKILI